eukprot:12104969-Ditylum_brightwellii.AAC.1
MSYLQEVMTQLHCTLYRNDKKDNDDNEAGLGTMDNIECYHCGEKGHKANGCTNPRKKQAGRGKNKSKCIKCGKKG